MNSKFMQFKEALEAQATSFAVQSKNGDVLGCMVYEYGDCNLIYGIKRRMRDDGELTPLSPFSHPTFIGIADKDGSNIVLSDVYSLTEDDLSDVYLDEIEPLEQCNFLNVLEEMNRVITETHVESFKNKLLMSDFADELQTKISQAAEGLARTSTINGRTEEVTNKLWSAISSEDYISIRAGEKTTAEVVDEYCKAHSYLLMVYKVAQQLLDKGEVLTENEERLANALRPYKNSTTKTLTVTFEIDGKTSQAKMPSDKLRLAFEGDGTYIALRSDGGNEYNNIPTDLFNDYDGSITNERPITFNDIKTITHGKQLVYIKDSDIKETKKKMHTHDEER